MSNQDSRVWGFRYESYFLGFHMHAEQAWQCSWLDILASILQKFFQWFSLNLHLSRLISSLVSILQGWWYAIALSPIIHQILLKEGFIQALDIAFYGDSIAETWRGTDMGRECARCAGGREIFERFFQTRYNAHIFAVGGKPHLWKLLNSVWQAWSAWIYNSRSIEEILLVFRCQELGREHCCNWIVWVCMQEQQIWLKIQRSHIHLWQWLTFEHFQQALTGTWNVSGPVLTTTGLWCFRWPGGAFAVETSKWGADDAPPSKGDGLDDWDKRFWRRCPMLPEKSTTSCARSKRFVWKVIFVSGSDYSTTLCLWCLVRPFSLDCVIQVFRKIFDIGVRLQMQACIWEGWLIERHTKSSLIPKIVRRRGILLSPCGRPLQRKEKKGRGLWGDEGDVRLFPQQPHGIPLRQYCFMQDSECCAIPPDSYPNFQDNFGWASSASSLVQRSKALWISKHFHCPYRCCQPYSSQIGKWKRFCTLCSMWRSIAPKWRG